MRNQKKYGKTIPQLGTQRKELEPLRVPMLPVLHETDLHAAQFHAETGLMLEQAVGRTDDIPVAPVVAIPYKLRKPFVTEEGEISLGTQMYNLHKSYLRMSNDETDMFGVVGISYAQKNRYSASAQNHRCSISPWSIPGYRIFLREAL